MTPAAAAGKLLANLGQKVSVAESSSGGVIAARLLAVPGASKFFEAGVVAYTSDVKRDILKIGAPMAKVCCRPAHLSSCTHACVALQSATKQHAIELATAARTTMGTDWGIGETGVAGPTPNSRGVVAGVSALAVAGPDGALATTMLFPSSELSSDRDAYGKASYARLTSCLPF